MSPFEILGIDPDADEEEIKRAYRRRVKETHPDQGGSLREFRSVRMAYEELVPEYRSDESDLDRETGGQRRERVQSRVEYLDYGVLDARGWSIDDEDLFEKAAADGLGPSDYGQFLVRPDETLLQAAENRGFTWPYSCRGGACANCAVAVTEGDLSQPVNHVLPPEMTDCGFRLSCVGAPTTDELQVVFDLEGLSPLDELRLPPGPFAEARRSD